MQTGPTELDIVFGRALLSFGLLSKPKLDECLALQRKAHQAGQAQTLAQIVVGLGLINREQYQALVTEIKRRYAQGESKPESPPEQRLEPDGPPEIPISNRYTPDRTSRGPAQNMPWSNAPPATGDPNALTMPLPIPKLPLNIGASSGPGPGPGPGPAPLLGPPPTPSPDPSRAMPPGPGPSKPGPAAGWELVSDSVPETAQRLPDLLDLGKKKSQRKDESIRAVLGIPENVEEFPFGSYTVLGMHAAGGMGVIYRARAKNGEIHALKALMNVEKATEKQIARFNEEGRLMSRLKHPNIVQVYEYGTFKNVPYFTMDFLEGDDFHDLLRAGSRTIRSNVECLRDIAQAVGYAHEQGVVHRDLKPSNVFVLRSGKPVLTDFGLAKNLQSDYKLTAEGSMVGTPLYLSPEQVAGRAHEADGRVDVYGLGVILYQIVTGRLPFLGKNPYDVYKQILAEDPKAPTSINKDLDKEIEKIIYTAIAKRPDERFQTATELAEDLSRWLKGEAVRCKPPPAGRRYKKSKKKRESGREEAPAAPPPPGPQLAFMAENADEDSDIDGAPAEVMPKPIAVGALSSDSVPDRDSADSSDDDRPKASGRDARGAKGKFPIGAVIIALVIVLGALAYALHIVLSK